MKFREWIDVEERHDCEIEIIRTRLANQIALRHSSLSVRTNVSAAGNQSEHAKHEPDVRGYYI